MPTINLVRGMGSFSQECEHPESRWPRCPHPYTVRYRDAAGKQTEESGFSTQDKAKARLTDVYHERKNSPQGQRKAERIQKYSPMQFAQYVTESRTGRPLPGFRKSQHGQLRPQGRRGIQPDHGAHRISGPSGFRCPVWINFRTMSRSWAAVTVVASSAGLRRTASSSTTQEVGPDFSAATEEYGHPGTSGSGVEDTDVKAAEEAGLTDGEVAEVITHVALNVFTNHLNKAADVATDWPVVRADS